MPQSSDSIKFMQDTAAVSASELEQFFLVVQSLTVRDKNEPVLDDISFVAKPGRLLGIVGPSGSNYDKLVSIIGMQLSSRHQSGRVAAVSVNNGRYFSKTEAIAATKLNSISPVKLKSGESHAESDNQNRESLLEKTSNNKTHNSRKQISKKRLERVPIGFLFGSDQHLLPCLTTYETLKYHADLQLTHLSKVKRLERIDWVLRHMGLEKCKDVYVGGSYNRGLSTGERRRLLIALELLDKRKTIIVMNTPTRGLDSYLAVQIIEFLRDIAHSEQRCFIVSLYQPSSAALKALDDVLFLNEGKCIYNGPMKEAVSYFENLTTVKLPRGYCIVDYIIDEITTNIPHITLDSTGDLRQMKKMSSNKAAQKNSVVHKWPSAYKQSVIGKRIEEEVNTYIKHHEIFPLSRSKLRDGKVCESILGTGIDTFTLYKRSNVNCVDHIIFDTRYFLSTIFKPGLLMGSIMWQYLGKFVDTHPVHQPVTANLIEASIDFFTEGFGTNQETGEQFKPFLDILEKGVDGKGFYLLPNLISYDDGYLIKSLRQIFRCFRTELDLGNEYKYPPSKSPWGSAKRQSYHRVRSHHNDTEIPLDKDGFPLRPPKPKNYLSEELFNGFDVMEDIITMLQVSDFMFYRRDWKPVWACRNEKNLEGLTCLLRENIWMIQMLNKCSDIPYMAYHPIKEVVPDVMKVLEEIPPPIRKSYAKQDDKRPIANEPYDYFVVAKKDWERTKLIYEGLFTKQKNWPKLASLLFSYNATRHQKHLIDQKTEEIWNTFGVVVNWVLNKPVFTYSRDDDNFSPPRSEYQCSSLVCTKIKDFVSYIGGYEFPRLTVTLWTALTTTGCLFSTISTMSFFCFFSLLTFHNAKVLHNKETANGIYSSLSFFFATNLADLPFQILPPIIFAVSWGVMSGVVHSWKQLAIYIGIGTLVCFACFGLCYMIASASPTIEASLIIAPFSMMLWIIVAGFILREEEDIPSWARWLRHTSLHRYGWLSLTLNTFPKGGLFGSFPTEFVHFLAGCNTKFQIEQMAVILLSLGIAFRLISFIFLRFSYRKVGLLS